MIIVLRNIYMIIKNNVKLNLKKKMNKHYFVVFLFFDSHLFTK